ncbi:TetR/AcrR family transcriptional regulator [Paraconexibacter sp.]|uniref:TetR/AcrR family transcriptional regulator n=1 Tax=Paraconexibacter sp. TaxID=2949640 RepID=UPI00356686A6
MSRADAGTKDRDDWIEAALAAIEEGGLGAVAVEPLARRLGVTKGSFYWHFADRRALLGAVLATWQQRFVDDTAERFDAIADPRERLHLLLQHAFVELEPTVIVRLMAAGDDEDVAAALTVAAASRIALLQRAFSQLGLTPAAARNRAALAYSSYLGLAQLRLQAPGLLDSPRKVSAFLRDVETALLHDVARP